MTDPKRPQDTSQKSEREIDRQGTPRETERQVERNPEPHRQGNSGAGREGRQV